MSVSNEYATGTGVSVPGMSYMNGRLEVAKVMPRNAQTSEASATPSPVKAIGATP